MAKKPRDEIRHPKDWPEDLEESEELEEQEDELDNEFAEIDQALSALEQDLGGDPSRLAEIASNNEYDKQPSSEEPEGVSNTSAPTE